ncbi:MAG TPA: hypothetical protein P5239_09815, partial [Victivallales bacterium]|nr:hypothetical protein [Victivallales bacterium]
MLEGANSDILEIICTASEAPNSKILEELLLRLSSFDKSHLSSLKNELDLIFDTWGNSLEKDQLKANFTLKLAAFNNPDTSSIRNALVLSARCLAPDFLTKSEAVKLSKAREPIPLNEIAERIKKISFLNKKDFCIYLLNNNEWVKIVDFDSILHTIELIGIFTSVKRKISIDVLIEDSLFFAFDENELKKYLNEISEISFNEWSNFLSSGLSVLSDEQIRVISLNTFVPQKMTAGEFTSWANSVNAKEIKSQKLKHPSEARGFIELKTLVEDFAKAKNKIHFSPAEASNIREIIFRGNLSDNEYIFSVFELFSIIFEIASDEESLKNLISSFKDFIDNVPIEDEKVKYELFISFDKFSLSRLKNIFLSLKKCKGVDFLANLALEMPIKLLSALTGIIDEKIILEIYNKRNAKANADLILWAWRNKNNTMIKDALITPDSVFTALSDKLEKKYRQNSIKDLKKKLLSDDKFISELVFHSINDNSPEHFLHLIDEDHVLLPSEKQSLIVKLARANDKFKKIIESVHNAGGIKLSKLLSDKSKDINQIVTSIKSHKAKILELEDIVQKQMPENSAAIAHARSYGDLRENAEFSAAKERQKFLRRRKFEIERELNTVS